MVILERYEGEFAVIETDGKMENIDRNLIAENTKEGSVLIKKEGIYYPDEQKTKARRQKIVELQDSLFE